MTKRCLDDASRRYRQVVGALLLFCVTALASAQCDLSNDPVTLSIAGFGTAHFQQFETDPAGTAAELSGSVCIVGEGGRWTITADRATLAGLRSDDELRAEIADATLLFDGWRVEAELLESDGEVLELTDVTFSGSGVMGSAGVLAIEAAAGTPRAVDVRVLGDSFRLAAEEALLTGDLVSLRGVTVTTCTCPGEPFYTVSGGSASLDLQAQVIAIEDGELELAGISVPLAERVELSSDEIDELSPPVTLEYKPNQGTGLGVVIPELELEEGFSLEMGILGLDPFTPLLAYALMHYREEGASFSVGRARSGPQADFELVREISPAVEAVFSVRNRHYPESDFLHEGVVSLRAAPGPFVFGSGQQLDWHGAAFSAASSQTISGRSVLSPRLGVRGGVRAQTSLDGAGTLALALEGESTTYPALGTSQYGVSLRPSWSYSRSPFTVSVSWNRLWTDSGSPFSAKLDRLTPSSRLDAAIVVAGRLAGGADGRFDIDFTYDLLRSAESDPGGLEVLGAGFGVSYPAGLWSITFESRIELAGLLDPDPGGDRDGYFAASARAVQGEWEAGSRFRYDLRPDERGLGLLEVSAAVPIEFDNSTITPFLALDFVPLIEHSELPRVSGHGINITWASCCGTVRLGYRQQEGVFSTSFGLALEH
ncbi:MAG TPA: hypothetical protein VF168_03000 [Trueperaceae bacterium]